MDLTYLPDHPLVLALVLVLGAWTVIWKGIALWHAGRNSHLAWFIVLLVVNTAGILEIIYTFAVGRPALRRSTAAGG